MNYSDGLSRMVIGYRDGLTRTVKKMIIELRHPDEQSTWVNQMVYPDGIN